MDVKLTIFCQFVMLHLSIFWCFFVHKSILNNMEHLSIFF